MSKPSPLSTPHLILFDVLSAIFSVGPGLLSWTLFFVITKSLAASPFLIPFLLVSPLVVALTFIVLVWAMRVAAPKLKPGVTRIGLNKGTLAWYVNLALNRAVKVSGLRYLLNVSYVLKFLTYRALGSRIAFGVHTPMEFTLVDLPLIEIGAGTTLGESVHVSCHYFMGDRLLLKPVKVGANCFIGMNTTVGPGSRLEDGAWVGYNNLVSGEHLTSDTRIGDNEWIEGSPVRREKSHQAIQGFKKRSGQ